MQSKDKILELVRENKSNTEKLQAICDYLNQANDRYDWVGFYFKNGSKNELKLGPYSGEETDHVIIPFGKGICGQVAVSNETLIVSDVSAESNYISCGWKVKSEIVIPVFVNGENIGQIDIDSHTLDAFDENDEEILNFVCEEVAKFHGVLDLVNN
jgi:GAF domain-containing protein